MDSVYRTTGTLRMSTTEAQTDGGKCLSFVVLTSLVEPG